MAFKLPIRRTAFLVLLTSLILGSALLVQPVAASTYVGFTATQEDASSCSGTFCYPAATGQANTRGVGEMVQAPFSGTLVSASVETGSATPNKVAIVTFPSGTPATTAFGAGFCVGSCFEVNSGQSWTLADYEGVSGFTVNAFNTVSLASPVTVSNTQFVAIIWISTAGSLNYVMGACGGSSTGCASFGSAVACLSIDFASTNPTIGASFSNSPICDSVTTNPTTTGATFQQTGSGGQTVTVTQCSGNCGSPALTLTNTNSTHTVNFNQSITLFYEFQSNLNGFILNVTTSIAKSYTNGIAVSLGIYEVSSCPLGQSPFSLTCPGLLVQGGSNIFANPNKGKLSVAPNNGLIAVSNGQWVGVAVSATLSGLDLNDTNTNVALFQTASVGSFLPGSIAQSSTAANLCVGCKMGLWAWIIGNIVTSAPPTTPALSCIGPGLDCILTNIVNSSCSVVTLACQSGAGIFWVIVLTIVTMTAVLYVFSNLLPGINLGRVGLGDLAILFFLGWLAMFTSLSLIAPYIIVVVFFTVAWLFIGRAKGSGPI